MKHHSTDSRSLENLRSRGNGPALEPHEKPKPCPIIEVIPLQRRWATPRQAADYLQVHEAWLAKLRSKGLPGPKFHKRGKLIRYSIEDLDSFFISGAVAPNCNEARDDR